MDEKFQNNCFIYFCHNDFHFSIIMTDELILYIFKFPKVCILIVVFIGNYESLKEELSEEKRQKLREDEEKERERKDRLHQNYLKRKANGKQKEYEDRYKVRIEEKKQEKLKSLKRTGIKLKDLDGNL